MHLLAVAKILKLPQVKLCSATKAQTPCAIHQLDKVHKYIKVSLLMFFENMNGKLVMK